MNAAPNIQLLPLSPPPAHGGGISGAGGMEMTGTIRGVGKCACGGKWEIIRSEVTGDQTDLRCRCGQRPRYVFIDARPWGDRIPNDPKTGKKWDSYLGAWKFLIRMNDEKDAHTFDRSRYVPAKMKELQVATEYSKWIVTIDRKQFRSRYDSSKNAMEKYILPAIGKMDVRDVRRSHLDDLKEKLLSMPRDPSSVKTYLGVAGAFFRWLEYRETIPTVPKMPKVDIPYKETGWINRKGQEAILAKIASRHRIIFELLIETGMRQGEVCALRVRDIADGEIYIGRALDCIGKVKDTKAGRTRYISVSNALFARLEAHARGRFGEEPLFRNKTGAAYKSRGLWSIWNPASKAAGLPIAPRTGTRHSRASQLRRRREQETDQMIADQLGNTPAMAKVYGRPKGEEKCTNSVLGNFPAPQSGEK